MDIQALRGGRSKRGFEAASGVEYQEEDKKMFELVSLERKRRETFSKEKREGRTTAPMA